MVLLTTTTDGARVVGVVNGLCVLRDPNPVSSTASPEVVKGASVLLPRLPLGIKGFRLGKSKLIRFKPRNRLLPRPAWFLSNSAKEVFISFFFRCYRGLCQL